ncbi:eukaryotic translation initiation factor 5B-like [Patiria miniata]|uniref:Uncharacterized protein n=1 Tax=Patiria miniata TaxID=46514 RepID=A0A913ZMM6_PATMI|nr:eukaryotic translation initiation factor 5B-like [Patiria miniata]
MAAMRKKAVRFSAQDDLCLLREVVAQNPFSDKGKWATVAMEVTSTVDRQGFDVDTRRVRERTILLLEQFKKSDNDAAKKSGTNEEVGGKEELLQEILDLASEEEIAKETAKKKKEKEESKAKEMRKRAMETLRPEVSEGEPGPSSCNKTSVIAYLSEKAQSEQDLRKEELQLEKEKLKLEKERLEFQKEERRQQLEMEKKEKSMMFKMMQALIDNVNKD